MLQHATTDVLFSLRPHAEAAWESIQHLSDPLYQRASPYFDSATRWLDAQLGGLVPWQIAVFTAVTVLLLVWLLQLVLSAAADLKEAGG